jgi:hypothetical protein
MALVIADRVRETSTTTGTGTLTLDGAVTGFRTFGSAIGDGNTCYYTITLGADYEIGLGTVGTGTLARTTVLKSSNSNSAVDFGAGTKDVFVTYTAEKSVYKDASGNVNALGTISSGVWNGTEITVPYGGTGVASLIGIVKGNGQSAFSAATAGTDYVSPTGTETLTNKTLTDPAIIGTILEDVYTITDGAAFEIDPGNGSIQLITLGASRTPKATNFANGEAITLMVDDGTAYALTWTDATFGGSGVVWETDSGSAPTLTTTGYTTIVLWKVGGQVYGARVGNN